MRPILFTHFWCKLANWGLVVTVRWIYDCFEALRNHSPLLNPKHSTLGFLFSLGISKYSQQWKSSSGVLERCQQKLILNCQAQSLWFYFTKHWKDCNLSSCALNTSNPKSIGSQMHFLWNICGRVYFQIYGARYGHYCRYFVDTLLPNLVGPISFCIESFNETPPLR